MKPLRNNQYFVVSKVCFLSPSDKLRRKNTVAKRGEKTFDVKSVIGLVIKTTENHQQQLISCYSSPLVNWQSENAMDQLESVCSDL